jgi:hypothetical protein
MSLSEDRRQQLEARVRKRLLGTAMMARSR